MFKYLNDFVLQCLDNKIKIIRKRILNKLNMVIYSFKIQNSFISNLSIVSFKHCKCIGFVYEMHNKFAESTNISYLCCPF